MGRIGGLSNAWGEGKVRTAILTRNPSRSEGTFGDWLSDSGFKCVTLERLKTGDYPCIPPGVYQCELRWSQKHEHVNLGYNFGMVYGIKDVLGRSDILIHPANFVFQLQGCIAPGKSVMKLSVGQGNMQLGVNASRDTTKLLIADMGGKPFELTIKEI